MVVNKRGNLEYGDAKINELREFNYLDSKRRRKMGNERLKTHQKSKRCFPQTIKA